jgi:DNA polymerase III sliding clamp (beta) subunit (PCNA family)
VRIVTFSERLAAALTAADAAVKGGSVIGAHSVAQLSVVDGVAHVVASDGAVSLRTQIAAVTAEDGSALVAPHPVAAFAASLPAGTRVECRVEAGRLVVATSELQYRFAVTEGTYPAIDEAGGEVISIPATGLVAMLAAVRHAVDQRSAMVKLAAVDGTMRMYATDSYRLAMAQRPGVDGTWSVLFPLQWLQFALRYDPVSFDIDQRGRLATFKGPDMTVTIRLGAAAFPAVESALAGTPASSVRFDTRDLTGAVNRLSSVADGEPLRIQVDGRVELRAVSGLGDGVETVDGQQTGDAGWFGVNAKNLVDAVTACGEHVTLSYGAPNQPIWCDGERDGVTVRCVVMPTVWNDPQS